MAEDCDAQTTSPRSPVRRSTEERQLRLSRPSKPDRPPRRSSSPKKSPARRSTGSPDPRCPKKDDVVAPPRLYQLTTSNPSTRDQGASQPCARLRQLAAADGGVALQRLYAIIQRQRDEWYQSNYASGSRPSSATANPQNENTPTITSQPVNDQGRTSLTPGVVSGGTTGLVSSDYTEPSRVTTPFIGSGVSEFSRDPMQNDQGQATRTSGQVMPAVGFRESQSVRFQTPPVRPSDPMSFQTPGLVTMRDNLPFDNTPLQEISGGTLDSTAFKHTGQDLSGGTLESSTAQQQGQDIAGGTRQSLSPQRPSQDQVMPGLGMTREPEQFGSFQRPSQDAKGETPNSNSLQRLGSEEPGGNTQPRYSRQSGTQMPGMAAQQPRDTLYSNAIPQSGTQQPETSQVPQTSQTPGHEASRCYCGCLARLLLQQRGSLQQWATQPCSKIPCPPSRPSCTQAPLEYRPEAYHNDMSCVTMPDPSSNPETSPQSTGRTSMHASAGSLQHLASTPQSPRTSGMQMSHGAPQEVPPSPQSPRTSGMQMSHGAPLEAPPSPQSPRTSGMQMSHEAPQEVPPSPQSPRTSGMQMSHGAPQEVPPSPQSPRTSGMQMSHGAPLEAPPSPQSPRTSGMQMSHGAPQEVPPSQRPAESGNQAPEGDPPKFTDMPDGQHQPAPGNAPQEGQHQPPPGNAPQTSEPQTKTDSVGGELRGQEQAGYIHRQTSGSQVAPTARTVDDPQTFEERVSAEFQILKELALSLRNLSYLPTAVPPPPGTAFENCVLSELRHIRSRCTAYSNPGIYNQPNSVVGGNGRGSSTGPQNTNQAPEQPQDLNQGQGLHDSNQVSTFEQKVIAALRSINRTCEGGTNTLVDQNVSSPVKDTITDQSTASATRLFEELVLGKLNELGKEFFCRQTPRPTVSGVEPAQISQPNPEPVLPMTDPTSDTRRTSDARISQGGAKRPSDTAQQVHDNPDEHGARRSSGTAQQVQNKPDEQSPQSNTTQNPSFPSPGSGVDASDQPVEPSYIRASSQGTTPFTGRIGSLTFDTTASSPAGVNRTEQSVHIQNQGERGSEVNPVEDAQRRDTQDAGVLQQQQQQQRQSVENDQNVVQRQSRTDQVPPNPPNVSWADNGQTFQRISKAPQKSVQMQETIQMRQTIVGQRIVPHPATDNRGNRTTDDCETGSIDCDSDSDQDSIDSCSPHRLGFTHQPCLSPRQLDVTRKTNQTYLDCDYLYRASQLTALTDCRQRPSMPVQRPNWKSGPAELTQYTMSETQSSMSPRVQGPQSIAEPGSVSYNRPTTSIRPSATIPLSSTLKDGHVQSPRTTLVSELPSNIESERHRSVSTQETISSGIHDDSQVLQNRSFGGQHYGGSNGPQQPLPLGTGQRLRSPFDCSEIYYKVSSNAPLIDSRYRRGFASSQGVCDPLDQEAAEESLCWDDNRHASGGFSPMARDESDCTTGSTFHQRGRPCSTSLASEGLPRRDCTTPWPRRGRPSGVRNKYPPLHALDCSGERLNPARKTFIDSCSRRSSKRGRRPSYGKTPAPHPLSTVGTDPRCRSKNAEHIRRTTPPMTNRMLNCMGVAPSRSKYADDPCASSDSDTDCEC